MIALIALYAWTLIAGCLAAPALALLGCQLATRDRALQTLCVSQGSLLGVLLGMGIFQSLGIEGPAADAAPLFTALLCSAATYALTDRLVAGRMASRNTFFAFLFSLLVATGYLVSALFPALENHMAQIYFGDLATLSTVGAKCTAAGMALCLAVQLATWKATTHHSFEWGVFGEPVTSRERGFGLLALFTLCLSVQYLGFLFTVTALFLPTALLNHARTKGIRRHLARCAFVAAFGTAAGFLLSLHFTRLPTVPTIAWLMFLTGTASLLPRLRLRQSVRIVRAEVFNP